MGQECRRFSLRPPAKTKGWLTASQRQKKLSPPSSLGLMENEEGGGFFRLLYKPLLVCAVQRSVQR